ncbi:MAG: orotidine 5'-phosphate decarboxylase / HUMPS family protein [Oligoflexales bacterium]
MNKTQLWLETVKNKKSQLCVGVDPTFSRADSKRRLSDGTDKFAWCQKIIKDVAEYSAAVKINRNYIKDLSGEAVTELNSLIHELGMVSIDDSKIADIESSNSEGLFQAKNEGFDYVTHCPYPGNIKDATQAAHSYDLGLITVLIMSTPTFLPLRNAMYEGKPLYDLFCAQIKESGCDGIVLGAQSVKNEIEQNLIQHIHSIVGKKLVLIPGVGAQGGDAGGILKLFGDHCIVNVGRDVIYSENPAQKARYYRDLIRTL